MTDPLLTIDEATRTFRTSPKTIRRRLAAGEIEGAYKRPGDRGPEWVMPAGSLLAAGFPLRPGADAPQLPEDPTELAAYWERRAIDAESAGGPRREPEVEPAIRRARWRIPALCIGVLVLVGLAFIAGQLSAGDGDRAQLDAELVRTLLVARTQVDERIGVVGTVPPGVVPDGRRAEALDVDDLPRELPRYVVASAQAGWAPPVAGDERTPAAVLLSLPGDDTGVALQVFDTRAVAQDDAGDDPAPQADLQDDAPAVAGTASDGDGSRVDADPSPAPVAPGSDTASPTPAADGAPAPIVAPTHTVVAGESFWTVATEVVGATGERGTDAVAAYWTRLVDANADRLVQPGNPDLVHVGQVLVLPPPA